MVDATQSILFVPTEEQGRTAVRAPLADEANAVGTISKGDQILSQDANPYRHAVRIREFL
jgi:hypothetical protein